MSDALPRLPIRQDKEKWFDTLWKAELSTVRRCDAKCVAASL